MKQTDKDKTMEGRYRQFAGCDTLKASAKLSMLRDAGLLEMKGRGKATSYVPGDRFPIAQHEITPPKGQTTPPQGQTTVSLPKDLVSDLAALGRKAPRERVVELMVRLCSCRAMTKDDLVRFVNNHKVADVCSTCFCVATNASPAREEKCGPPVWHFYAPRRADDMVYCLRWRKQGPYSTAWRTARRSGKRVPGSLIALRSYA